MQTLFGAIRDAAGLSHQAAADIFGVRLDTVKSWSSGRRTAPPAVLEQARALLLRQEHEAAAIAATNCGADGAVFSSMLVEGDAGAAERGWPTADAYNRVIAKAWALSNKKGN
jgi:hypothetical protein